MARGNDESRNPNRRPKRSTEWHNMGMVDRRQGYINELVQQNKDDYASESYNYNEYPEEFEGRSFPTEAEYLAAHNPETYEDYQRRLPTDRAQTFGRPYQTPSGNYGFEWEHRQHPDDIGDASPEPFSNKTSLEQYKTAMYNIDSVGDVGDSYYRSERRRAAEEHYGEDYNEYRAWQAGEIPEETDEPAPYEAPEGWVAWYQSSRRKPPIAISNVEGTRHRLTQEFKTPSAARRAGRALLNEKLFGSQTGRLDQALPYNLTGMQYL